MEQEQESNYRVVFQLNAYDTLYLKSAVSQIRNAQKAIADLKVEWVLHGAAVRFLSKQWCESAPADDLQAARRIISDIQTLIASDTERCGQVKILACKNALDSQQIDIAALLPSVEVIQSAVAHLIRRQAAGWSYIKVG